jgi:DNA-binding response OmpR family regulator
MGDPGPRQLDTLSAHVEGLRTAAADLEVDPSAGDSIRRIARSLQSAAESLGAAEIAAGSHAILRATEAQLARSVTNFLERIEEIRRESPAEAVEILLVEDNKTVAAATTAYLTAAGWTTHVASTASEAEAILAQRHIDLVVLDLILPDRDGRDLLVQMREQASTAAIPVIVLSARGGPVTRTECLAVGADAFLEKPTAPGELRTAVSRLVRRRRESTDADSEAIDDADPTSLETRRILVVEDDNVTGTLIHHRLIRDGHEVFHFVNGEDAFEWASRESFDLAVLDVKVPGMDGFEILERLRRIPRLADVPVVMLTGMGGEADVVRGLDLGADDYMLKPFSPTELLARVRRLLHARTPGGDRRAPAGHGGGIAP